MSMERPSWDDYFMEMARLVSTRSTCTRRSVGAVLVKDRRVLATGYNGAPPGLKHCDELGCLRAALNIPSGERHEICRAIHGEQNALIQCAIHGVAAQGATLYCTTYPCSACAKMLIGAKIKEIIYEGSYPDPVSTELLEESGVVIRQLNK